MSTEFKETHKDDIDLNKLFRIIIRNKYIVLSSSLLFFLISVFNALNSKRIWEGYLQIVLPSQSKQTGINLSSRAAGLANLTGSFGSLGINSQLKTEVEILKSPSVLLPVFQSVLKSRNIPLDSNNFLTFNEWRKESLRIKLEQDTSVLNISFRDSDKEIILPVLRQITSQYKKYSTRDKEEDTFRRIKFLDKEIETYRQNTDNAYEEADNFALKHNLSIDYDSIKSTSSNPSNLQLTTTQEDSRMIALNELSRLREFSKQLEEVNDDPDIILFLAGDMKRIFGDPMNDMLPLVKDILDVKSSISVMQTNFTEEDKSIKELRLLEKNYQEELEKQLNGLIKARKKSAESVIQSSYRKPEITAKYKQLLREASKTESFLDKFLTEKKRVILDANFKNKNWDLITEPTLNPYPVAPFRKRMAALGLISGIVIGCIIAFVYERKRGIVYEIDEVDTLLDSKLIKTYSKDEKEELEETIAILANNISSIKNNKIISLTEVGDVEYSPSEEIKLCFEKNSSISKVYKSSNFKDCNKFINQILLISLGKIKRTDLIKVKEKLNMQSEPILGWINIKSI